MTLAICLCIILTFGLLAAYNVDAARSLENRPTHPRLRVGSIPSVADYDAHMVVDDIDDAPADDVEPNTRERGWMQTFSGRGFYPLEPDAKDVELVDVAHGLAMTCRYGGQCRMFYSVAEHCVLVSEIVEMHARNAGKSEHEVRRLAQLALMHDSAEAYIGDMIRPLKHQPEMSEFRCAEARIEAEIADAFCLHWTPDAHDIVKRIDDRILVDEVTYLMARPEMYLTTPLLRDLSPLGVHFRCMPPAEAEGAFLARYRELFT
jgi:5'-deoxynucleotidase YfbR-like HD superfamily hydrolase